MSDTKPCEGCDHDIARDEWMKTSDWKRKRFCSKECAAETVWKKRKQEKAAFTV